MKRLLSFFIGLGFVVGEIGTVQAETKLQETLLQDTEAFASNALNKNEACLEGPLAQFGRYLGDWSIQDWRRSQDGKAWNEGEGARWIFVCVGNGIAIQDFWMPTDRGVGTNLRIYNPKTQSWDITWTATTAPGLTHIRAQQDNNGNIVMHHVSPVQNPPRRVTFHPPTDRGWDWTLEMSFDDEKTWQEVYKIKATKR